MISDGQRLLIDISKAFYMEDMSKVEIAKRFQLSRFKVARLLEEARRLGIVHITISDPDEGYLADTLARRLGLKYVSIAPPTRSEGEYYDRLASAAAQSLESLVRPEMDIGISWGRTLVRVGLHLKGLPPVNLIQLTGMLSSDPNQSPLRVMANINNNNQAEGTAHALMAPLFASSPLAAERIRQEPQIRELLMQYNHLDIALISVGSWEHRITQLSEFLTNDETEELDRLGVIADCSGLFLDINGNEIHTALDDRRISISFEQLQAVPNVLAVAGEPEKARAIIAVARAGIATHLITTSEAAYKILDTLDTCDSGTHKV